MAAQPSGMNVPRDTFVAFVDALAERLDDEEVTGADLASLVHLSRFHFARLVSSEAGESPSRFRRRILLERSAYRLITTGTGVLDIALEAGFSSHEAFTRAFRRAYHVTPSGFRAAPGQVLIGSANGVHFHPPGSLRLPARTEATSMDLLQKMVDHHVWLVGEMVDKAATLSDEQLDKLVRVSVDNEDGTMTTRSILSRLIGQMDMWMSAIAMRKYDFAVESEESVDQMRQRQARVGPAFVDQVRTVIAEGRLDDTFIDALCEPAEVFTYGGMIAHVLTFAAYNRTLVVQALGEAGVEGLGWGDPMTWVTSAAS